jgi:hypothetical protein
MIAPGLWGWDFAEVFRQVLESNYILATSCARNHLGFPCNISVGTLLSACPQAAQSSRITTLFRSSTGTTGGQCLDDCAAQISDMISSAGCCVATAEMAELQWRSGVMGLPILGQQFRVDWGTGFVEELSTPSHCSSNGALVDTACLTGLCLPRARAWPAVCCDAAVVACMNGGVQAEPGTCVCACPNGWTGTNCGVHALHILLDMKLIGMTRQAWVLGAAGWFHALVASKLEVELGAVELDGSQVEENERVTSISVSNSIHVIFNAQASKGSNRNSKRMDILSSSFKVRVRVLASSDDDLLRIKKIAALLTLSQVSWP